MEEIEAIIAEQYRNLPDWWPDEVPFSGDDR